MERVGHEVAESKAKPEKSPALPAAAADPKTNPEGEGTSAVAKSDEKETTTAAGKAEPLSDGPASAPEITKAAAPDKKSLRVNLLILVPSTFCSAGLPSFSITRLS